MWVVGGGWQLDPTWELPFHVLTTDRAWSCNGCSYSEAEKVFERYKDETAYEALVDPDTSNTRLGMMRHWLQYHYLGLVSTEIYPSCLQYSSSQWQALCRKFELVLDMTEFVRDPMLKAEIIKQYASVIGERCLYKIKTKSGDAGEEDNASTPPELKSWQRYHDKLERWFKEGI